MYRLAKARLPCLFAMRVHSKESGAVEAEVPHGVECLRDAKHIWERIGGVVDEF